LGRKDKEKKVVWTMSTGNNASFLPTVFCGGMAEEAYGDRNLKLMPERLKSSELGELEIIQITIFGI